MGLKYVDNYQWSTTANLPATFQSTIGATITGNRFHCIPGPGTGSKIANGLTAQATYNMNYRVNIESPGHGSPSVGQDNFAPLHYFFDINTVQSGIGVDQFGRLQFSRANVPIGPTSTIALTFDTLNSFYDIETKIVIGAVGSIECHVNGAIVIPSSAQNTQFTANATADGILMRDATGNPSTLTGGALNFDHIIAMDGTGANLNGNFIGPVDVILLPPTGDGFYTAWNLTGAANRFTAVQTNDGDTSYISASVVGTKNTFTSNALPIGSTGVVATGVWAVAREDDQITRSFKVLMRSSTPTDALGSIEQFVGSTYLYFFQPYEVSPFTGVAWTVSEVNTTQYGVQVTQ